MDIFEHTGGHSGTWAGVTAPFANGVTRITPHDLDEVIRRGDRLAVLDVRRRGAWTEDPARIPGAMWLPLEEVPQRARELPADSHLVVYCS